MDKVLPVAEAARVLGISRDALYKRIRRNTVVWERGADGRLYVDVDTAIDESMDTAMPGASNALISEMHARIESLEHQLAEERNANRENRRLLAAALERIPAIEAPEPRDAPENDAEPRPGTETPASDATQPRASWWRRFFGFGERRK